SGGSRSDGQHIAAEFVGRFAGRHHPLPAEALSTNTSILTALANDYAFEEVFRLQIEALARRGDAAIGFTTSGRSQNVLVALDTARRLGLYTVVLTGATGEGLRESVDECIVIPSAEAHRVQ